MKKYVYFILCGLIGSALFTSCNKDDDSATPELKSEKIKYNPDGSIAVKEVYTYDKKGRVTCFESYFFGELFEKEYNFKYEGTTATFERMERNNVYTGKKVFRNEKCIYDEFITNQYFDGETEIQSETYTINDAGFVTSYIKVNDYEKEERSYTYEGNVVKYTKNVTFEDFPAEVTDYTIEYADASYKQIKKINIVLDPNTEDSVTKEYVYSYDNQGRINGVKYYYQGELYEEQKDYSYNGSKVTYKECMYDNGEMYNEYTCEEINWKGKNSSEALPFSPVCMTFNIEGNTPEEEEIPLGAFWNDVKYSKSEYMDAGITVSYGFVTVDKFYLTKSVEESSFMVWKELSEDEANNFVEAYKNCGGNISSYECWVRNYNDDWSSYKYCKGVDAGF